MERSDLMAIIARERPAEPDRHGMIASLCPDSYLATAKADDLKAKIQTVSFLHKASTPDDDDEYWAAQSPFDGRWYLFASGMGGAMPTEPVRVSNNRPSVFED